MKFIDEVIIKVQGGDGGNGCVSFRREKYVPRGGPDGGNGGDGGNVYLRVNSGMNTLLHLHYKKLYRAGRGRHGKGKDMDGKRGEDIYIEVPPGTEVYDAETGEFLKDLISPGEIYLAAKGGKGGRGNKSFATSTNRSPRYAEKGEKGEVRILRLELKLLADVGIVGLPNAGKSTLISKISSAKPKIADYPFTTTVPNLGVVKIDDKTFVVADMPGLIKGAHRGAGLGHQFLRHIERTKIILHLIDPTSGDPLNSYQVIREELEKYSPQLAGKKEITAVNKIDLLSRKEIEEIKKKFEEKGIKVYPVSALTGNGVKGLLYAVSALLFPQ